MAIIPQETIQKGRFKEMAMETNKDDHFRIYESKEEAKSLEHTPCGML